MSPLILNKIPALLSICLLFPATLHSATPADRELVYLVDARNYSASDFDHIIERTARFFTRPLLGDAVMYGADGELEPTVVIINASGEAVRVSWKRLLSVLDFHNFGFNFRQVRYSYVGGYANSARTISSTSRQIAANNFAGTNRQITMVDGAAGIYAADAPLATNVDVIDTIAFNAPYSESTVNNFYSANVVGDGGTNAAVSTSQEEAKSALELAPTVLGTIAHFQSVPEPSTLLLSGMGVLLLLRKRR